MRTPLCFSAGRSQPASFSFLLSGPQAIFHVVVSKKPSLSFGDNHCLHPGQLSATPGLLVSDAWSAFVWEHVPTLPAGCFSDC